MRRGLRAVTLFIALLILCGCEAQGAFVGVQESTAQYTDSPSPTPIKTTKPSASAPEPTPEPTPFPIPAPAMLSYGKRTVLSGVEGRLTYSLAYPLGEIEQLNAALEQWSLGIIEEAAASLEALGADNPALTGSVNVDCDYEIAFDRYVSVVLAGSYRRSDMDEPVALLFAAIADTASGQTIPWYEVITPEGREPTLEALLLTLADEHLTGNNESAPEPLDADVSWLSHPLLHPNGVVFLLPSGRFLPKDMGVVSVFVSYSDLGESFALPTGGEELELTHEPPDLSKSPFGKPRGIDPDMPMIAFTFDDGPSSQVTSSVLDLLDYYGARATFCLIGKNIKGREYIVKRAYESGNEIASHTWAHSNLTNITYEEIYGDLKATNEYISGITGESPGLLRPPYGAVDERVQGAACELNMAIIRWSVDTVDWQSRDADMIYYEIMSGVNDGGIVLCHDLYPETVQALERAIPELLDVGYQLVTVSELLRFSKKGIVPGEVYKRR